MRRVINDYSDEEEQDENQEDQKCGARLGAASSALKQTLLPVLQESGESDTKNKKRVILNKIRDTLGTSNEFVSEEENNDSNLGSSEEEDPNGEPFLAPNASCPQHKLKIHSFQRKTKKLLCTLCVQEQNMKDNEILVFRQAIREIKCQIQDTKDLNKLRKMQLTSVMASLNDE